MFIYYAINFKIVYKVDHLIVYKNIRFVNNHKKLKKMKFITLFLFASVATAIRSRERLWKTISKSEIASYIVGGRDVMDGEAPWQVALQDSLPEYLCGGSIVTERWVLTSATCVPRLLQR